MGLYSGFLDDPTVTFHAVEPLGTSNETGKHAATLSFGASGTLHGAQSLVLQQEDGKPSQVSSVASGLVYPGVGPEIAMLHEDGRIKVLAVSDKERISTFFRIAKSEGIIPALESSHALAFAIRLAEPPRPHGRMPGEIARWPTSLADRQSALPEPAQAAARAQAGERCDAFVAAL